MPKVLIFGATGAVGQALARSLRRSGNYTVYGVARTPEKARQLEALEVIPVAGSATDSGAYRALIRDAHIDVVVDVAQAFKDAFHIIKEVRAAGEERLRAAREHNVPLSGAKLGFVYTSGTWVHGPTPAGAVVNDLDPVLTETAVPFVSWRVECEGAVLACADVLDVAVVRPAEVYGLRSQIFSSYFDRLQSAVEADSRADVTLPVDPDARVGLVHVDDAGSGLHAVVDKLPLLGGTGVWPVFDLSSSIESLAAILIHAARAFGVQGRVLFESPAGNVVASAISTSVVVDSGRARSLLGWAPAHPGMLGEVDLYVRAWKACKFM